MQLAGIMIGTEDPKKLADFYTKVMGDPVWEKEGWYVYKAGSSSIVVGEHSEVKGMSAEPQRLIINLDSKDVKADFDRIVQATGAKVVAEPYQPDASGSSKAWLATLADPDGNYLQLATPWEDMEDEQAENSESSETSETTEAE